MDYSAPRSKIPRKTRRPFGWVKPLAIGVAATCAVIGVLTVVVRYYLLLSARNKTAAVIARLDRDEPGWRLEEIEAGRKVLPESANSALTLLAAHRLLPPKWPQVSATKPPATPSPKGQGQADLIDQLLQGDPFLPPNEAQLAALQAELAAIGPALAETRKVIDLSEGRYEVAWALNPLQTPLPHTQSSRYLTRLLKLDSIQRVHRGDIDGALASCRGILNVGRSLGDEPVFVTQLVRIEAETIAIRSIEHVLAFGEPSDEALAILQGLLEDEEAQPLYQFAVRGERGAMSNLYARLASGEIELGDEKMPPLIHWLYAGAMYAEAQGIVLDEMSEAVAIAAAPLSQQHDLGEAWNQAVAERSSRGQKEKFARLLLPAALPTIDSYVMSRTRLRTAIMAIAAERYRRKHSQWPESADRLSPWPLAQVPVDPHTDGPLIWRHSGDTLVIYSPGLDLTDNEGAVEQDLNISQDEAGKPRRNQPKWKDRDLGFRLRDVTSRQSSPSSSKSPD